MDYNRRKPPDWGNGQGVVRRMDTCVHPSPFSNGEISLRSLVFLFINKLFSSVLPSPATGVEL